MLIYNIDKTYLELLVLPQKCRGVPAFLLSGYWLGILTAAELHNPERSVGAARFGYAQITEVG